MAMIVTTILQTQR